MARAERAPARAHAAWGDAVLQSRKTAERLQRVLPQARVCVYRDAGHALIGVGQEILAFLPTDYSALGINRR